jgi:broad specificity phosphatase PhoE
MISVLFVRHADIDLPPLSKDPPLNAAGLERAHALAHVAKMAGISAIFTSEFLRTKQTVMPLANLLGLPPREITEALLGEIRRGTLGNVVLIAGHSNTVPDMMAALGVPSPLPTIGQREFDNLFVVTLMPSQGQAGLVGLHYGRESR